GYIAQHTDKLHRFTHDPLRTLQFMSDQHIEKPGGMEVHPPCQAAEEQPLEEAKSDEDPDAFCPDIAHYICKGHLSLCTQERKSCCMPSLGCWWFMSEVSSC